MREVACAKVGLFLQSVQSRRHFSSEYIAAVLVRLRWKDCEVCGTRAEGFHAKGWGFCGCNPAIR
jgi:hypothetical protein